jgi:RNA polymerase sigma factor (sigma-70 family)
MKFQYQDVYTNLYKELSNRKNLGAAEEIETLKLAQAGDIEARGKLIMHTYKFIITISSKYRSCGSFDAKDLFQEGVFGIDHAIDTFNMDSGCRFSTYVFHWIRLAIQQYVGHHASCVTGPLKAKMIALKLQTASQEDIAFITHGIKDKQVDAIALLQSNIISLDKSDGLNSRETIGTLIVDQRYNVEADYEKIRLNEQLRDSLWCLEPREKIVIEERYLKGYIQTIDEIAAKLKVTRQRADQIEKKALQKLRENLSRSEFA